MYNKKAADKYRHTEKGKQAFKKAFKKWQQSLKGKKINAIQCKKYYYSHLDKEKIRKHNYLLTPTGREKIYKHNTKRERNLGFNIVFENIIDEPSDWHHTNDNDVIAIPRDLHRLYCGENHRKNLKYIIKQIYKEV